MDTIRNEMSDESLSPPDRATIEAAEAWRRARTQELDDLLKMESNGLHAAITEERFPLLSALQPDYVSRAAGRARRNETGFNDPKPPLVEAMNLGMSEIITPDDYRQLRGLPDYRVTLFQTAAAVKAFEIASNLAADINPVLEQMSRADPGVAETMGFQVGGKRSGVQGRRSTETVAAALLHEGNKIMTLTDRLAEQLQLEFDENGNVVKKFAISVT